MNPEVSIIIPTYNREKMLGRSIDSVRSQTVQDFELIIVDDCSTDGTRGLVESYRDDRIIYHRNKTNLGAGGARNAGAAIARGEYIAFQDSDDQWLPDKLEKQLKKIKEPMQLNGKSVGMVYCSYRMTAEKGEILFPWESMPWEQKSGDIFHYLIYQPAVSTPTMLIKRSAWKEIGGFEEKLRSLEDWEFSIRMAKEHLIILVEEPLVEVFASEGGVNHDTGGRIESEFYILQQYREWFHTPELLRQKLAGIVKRTVRQDNQGVYLQYVLRYLDMLLESGLYHEMDIVVNIPETVFLKNPILMTLQKIMNIHRIEKDGMREHILHRGHTAAALADYYVKLVMLITGVCGEESRDENKRAEAENTGAGNAGAGKQLLDYMEAFRVPYQELVAVIACEFKPEEQKEIINLLGCVCFDQGNVKMGLELLKTAYYMDSGYQDVIINLAYACYFVKDYESASYYADKIAVETSDIKELREELLKLAEER